MSGLTFNLKTAWKLFSKPFLLLLWLGACAIWPQPTPAPSPTPLAATLPPPRPVPTESTAEFIAQPLPLPTPAATPLATRPVAPTPAANQWPHYSTQLAYLANPAALPLLTEAEQSQLQTQGFLQLSEPFASPYDIYRQASQQNQPWLITADLVLYATAQTTQQAWPQARQEYLGAAVAEWTTEMLTICQTQWEVAQSQQDGLTAEAARKNWAYFALVGQLLGLGTPLHPAVAETVQSELTLLNRGGSFISPLLGEIVDYTPFQATTDPLTQALLWYQTIGLRVDDPAVARLHGRQIRLLLATQSATWSNLVAILTHFEGAQEPTLATWQAIDQATLTNELDGFVVTAQQLPHPTFYFLPQPHPLAEEVITALTYNRVGSFVGTGEAPFTAGQTSVGLVRLLSHPADAPAVFGSEVALAYLQNNQENAYTGFEAQFEALRQKLSTTHSQTIHWLQALAPLLAAADTRPFTQQPAWAERQLQVWQMGWLMAHQPLPPRPAGEPLPQPAALWLEPQPLLYAHLASYVQQTRQILAQVGWLSQSNGDKLYQLEGELWQLHTLANYSAAGYGLTAAEQTWLWQWLAKIYQQTGDPLPLTYVYQTESVTQQQTVITVANSSPFYLIVLQEGQPQVAVGATFNWQFSR